MSLPGGILNDPRWIAIGEDLQALPGALLYAFEPGGSFSTPKPLYTTSALTIELTNPVEADADGRFPAMYLDIGGYDLILKDANDVQIWSCRNVEDIGQSFLSELGSYLAEGRSSLSSGDTILSSDLSVTVDGTGGPDPCIINAQPVADRTEELVIQNRGDVDVAFTPAGSETVNGVAAVFTIPAGTTPNWPTLVVRPRQADTDYLVVSASFFS